MVLACFQKPGQHVHMRTPVTDTQYWGRNCSFSAISASLLMTRLLSGAEAPVFMSLAPSPPASCTPGLAYLVACRKPQGNPHWPVEYTLIRSDNSRHRMWLTEALDPHPLPK